MTEVSNELIFETLKRIQADLADLKANSATKADLASMRGELKADVASLRLDMSKNMSLLSDGILSLRREIEIIGLSTAGHGERLSDVEVRLGRIEHHLGVH